MVDWEEYAKRADKLLEEQNWIPIWANFCQEMTDVVVPLIFKAKSLSKKEVRLLIDSNGGSVISVVAIGNALKLCGLPSIGLVLGRAWSGGFFTLQYCDKRLAVDGAWLMPHWGQYPLGNAEIASIVEGEDWAVDTIRYYTRFLITQTQLRSGRDLSELNAIFRQERDMTATQALEYGFIDKIITKPDPNLSELTAKAKKAKAKSE